MIYLLFNNWHFIPLLILDNIASFLKQVDNFSIFEGKGSNCDLDMFNRIFLVAQIWQSVQPLLHLILDPVSEGLHAGDVLNALLVLPAYPFGVLFNKEVIKEAWSDVKLNCVVSSCYSFDIPFDIVVFLNLLDVVQIKHYEECQKDSHAPEAKCSNLPLNDHISGYITADLEVH